MEKPAILRVCSPYFVRDFIKLILIMSGVLNEKYFSKNMTEDILCFLEDSLPKCRNVYFPYHIDFAAVTGCDEYNGEYSA